MVETNGDTRPAAAVANGTGDSGTAEKAAGEAAPGVEAQLWQLRRDIARLREDVAAMARSRAAKARRLVRRNPWPAMAAALCAGLCLGRRVLRH